MIISTRARYPGLVFPFVPEEPHCAEDTGVGYATPSHLVDCDVVAVGGSRADLEALALRVPLLQLAPAQRARVSRERAQDALATRRLDAHRAREAETVCTAPDVCCFRSLVLPRTPTMVLPSPVSAQPGDQGQRRHDKDEPHDHM